MASDMQSDIQAASANMRSTVQRLTYRRIYPNAEPCLSFPLSTPDLASDM